MVALQRVASSCLTDVGYDFDARVLMLGFRHGGVYRYSDVPAFVYEGLMKAPSLGRYFQRHVRGSYAYKRVNH